MPQRHLTSERVLESLLEGVLVIDPGGRATYANARASEILGCGAEGLVGRLLTDFFYEEDLDAERSVAAGLRNGGSTRGERRMRRADGLEIWCSVSSRPILGKAGQFVGVVTLISDVTAHHVALRALRESEERFRSLFEVMAHGALCYDAEGNITAVNPAALRILGLTSEQVIGRTAWGWTVVTEDGLPFPPQQNPTMLALRTGRPAGGLIGLVRDEDANCLWLSAHSVPQFDSSGAVMGVITTFEDVTERRRIEAALRDSEHWLREAQRAGHLGTYDLDLRTGMFTCSEVLDEIFGLAPGDTHSFARWTSIVHPDDRQELKDYALSVFERGTRFDRLYRVIRASDGQVRWVQGYGEVGRDAEGRPVRLFGTIQDVTDRVRQEEERRTFEARLLQGQKLESLGVLAGGLAHEFNNLLTSILGNADLALADLPPDSTVRGNIRAIESASRRAAEISHQMLAYSGRGQFVVEPVVLSRLVGDMARMLEVTVPRLASLRFQLEDPLPPVDADATQIRQLVLNLVLNAAEALDRFNGGVVRIATGERECTPSSPLTDYLREPLPHGPYVYLEVGDTGCGMDEETRSRAFDPFFSTKSTGRGLGLPAVLGIARGHHAFIQVESELGRGSVFRLLFPRRVEAAGTGAEAPPTAAASSARPLVLVVDDEDGVRTLTMKMVERCGYRTLGAADGVEALRIVDGERDELAVVVLDLNMPRMGGEQVLRELRRIAPNLPVLVSSGYSVSEMAPGIAGLGVSGFLDKPYRLSDLKAKLEAALAS